MPRPCLPALTASATRVTNGTSLSTPTAWPAHPEETSHGHRGVDGVTTTGPCGRRRADAPKDSTGGVRGLSRRLCTELRVAIHCTASAAQPAVCRRFDHGAVDGLITEP